MEGIYEALTYLHCRHCINQKPKNQSAEEYARISVASTKVGILIWCVRHDEMIAHFPYDWGTEPKCECPDCKGNSHA